MNPFVDNISLLKDEEIEKKILDLSKKFMTAQRLGKIDLLTQLQTFITIYRDELSQRRLSKKNQLDNDLDQLINVD
jgi:hypothetical protein